MVRSWKGQAGRDKLVSASLGVLGLHREFVVVARRMKMKDIYKIILIKYNHGLKHLI